MSGLVLEHCDIFISILSVDSLEHSTYHLPTEVITTKNGMFPDIDMPGLKTTDLYYTSVVKKLACDIKDWINLKLNVRDIICKTTGNIKYILDLS